MDTLFHDLRYAFRMAGRTPGFSIVVVLVLALGIGANTAIFSVVNAVLFRVPPVQSPDSLVSVFTSDSGGDRYSLSSYPDFQAFRDDTGVFSDAAAYSPLPMALSAGDHSELILGEVVTANYFPLLGVQPNRGRAFLLEEGRPGAPPVAVISHAMWQRRYHGDPALLGTTLQLNGHPFTVVGIAPEGFTGLTVGVMPDLWVPTSATDRLMPERDRLDARGHRWLFTVGRLMPGASIRQADAALETVSQRLAKAYPETNADRRVSVLPLQDALVFPGIRGMVLGFVGLLMGVVGLVLLIACANVANLLLARAAARRREIGIRLALGASRGRIVRQLLTESTLLALIAGAAGLLVAVWMIDLLMAFKPPLPIPVGLDLALDARVLVFTLAASTLTGIVFGLAPALQTTRRELVPALRQDDGGGYRRSRLRASLIVVQVAFSMLLLIGAGLCIRSLQNAHGIDPGFTTDRVLMMSFDLQMNGYSEASGRQLEASLLERLRAMPGVEAASLAQVTPLGLKNQRTWIQIEGYAPKPGEDMELEFNRVSPDFFATLGVPLMHGRDFSSQDSATTTPVVVVNEALARRFWPGADPIGRRLSRGDRQMTVVGVVRDSKYRTLGESARAAVFLPLEQQYASDLTLHVRSRGNPAALVVPVQAELRALAPGLSIFDVKTMDEHLSLALFPARLAASFLGAFGGLAMLLASIGLYGMMAFMVTQRTREIGIRVALGAKTADVLALIMRHALRLTGVGMAIGVAGALAVTRFMDSLLYGISPQDPLAFAAVVGLLAAVAVLASYLPARRATRVDPMIALRSE